MENNKILLISGGTFGHLIPSVYLSKKILNNFNFFFITDSKIKNCNFLFNNSFFFINTFFFINKKIFLFINILVSFLSLFFVFLLFKPKIVLCFGNYLTIPLFFLNFFFSFSFFIFEQNIIIGRSNLILFFFSKKIFIHYKNYYFFYKIFKFCYCHYFLNKFFFILNKNISLKKKEFKLLFLGGSNGSLFINNIVFDLCLLLNRKSIFFFFLNQTGDLRNFNLKFSVFFFNKSMLFNIHNYLNNFDILITRSGAGILNEIYYKKFFFILLPIKNSVLNHQYFNCLFFFRKSHFLYIKEEEHEFMFIYKYILENFFFLNIYNKKKEYVW